MTTETPRKCFRGQCAQCSGIDVITGAPCQCACHPTLVQRLRGFALESDCLEAAAELERLQRELLDYRKAVREWIAAVDALANLEPSRPDQTDWDAIDAHNEAVATLRALQENGWTQAQLEGKMIAESGEPS